MLKNIINKIIEGKTFSFSIYNLRKDILNNYFIQLSFIDPWFIPHKEQRFNNGSWAFGWLFIYFGNIISEQRKDNENETNNTSNTTKTY